MAGSIEDNAALYKKKTFAYVQPTPPAELIESTTYTLDFTNRKFVHIGIDPTEHFQVAIHLLTSSRHVNISPDFLKRIFSMMGHILSFILDTPQKCKRFIFLETESHKISSMVYGGENVLVIESKTHKGCRVLVNRADLISLQYLEWCIFETVTRKSTITQPVVLKQFDMFSNYINVEFHKLNSPPKTTAEMITFVKNLHDDTIISNMPKNDVNHISQIKMYASTQLVKHWEKCFIRPMSPELLISPLSPPTPLSPPPHFYCIGS
ncbi:uncharacterized protein LOC100569355 [Acyrthosiphon pisum]|uniref:Uncharacterized protein n=1 Tax=Acyrthosiphon pisum TaxID=7029 RepID=A0A8R2ABX3_ACYPI|nr:uncharacterized protein LOC100569355 [Acyrthosiphon pisum]|eukprot:XP_003244216.1 PREDICTED: uncharacterized protein LOC100569355 [Acyrthosiphon pisum]